ncbi:hypothetical protein TrRE_jg1518 [Triparma retinervis]|uniref:Uncharacterized protein n=1 Tax=Triparma retinervis TaxID=2557542 RepID=A0A9W7AGC0_9STRA|nr:hypothetical protein TrRE_jg1518 [Triparma retinervis]
MRSSPVLLIIIFLGSGSPFHLLSSRVSRSSTLPSPAYGPSGAVVNSPPVVKSLSLEEFLNLSKAKQRQFEGSFVSCTTVKGAKQCKPVSVIDGLLNDMKADEIKYLDVYKQLETLGGNDQLEEQKRLEERQRILQQLAKEPAWVNYAAGFTASCVSTLVMHPLDTIKTRLMSKKSSPSSPPTSADFAPADGPPNDSPLSPAQPEPEPLTLSSVSSLYEGLFANMLKEAPASALYLGLYESSLVFLTQFGFFQEYPLVAYLLSGAIGELIGSMIRAPAEAVKTRLQTGDLDFFGAVSNTFGPEGLANTFTAWSSSLFRDVPAGAIQIALFELTKTLIIDDPNISFDVNTLASEALIGGFGGGMGAFLTNPSDVVTTKIISGGATASAKEVFQQVLAEEGVLGFLNGWKQRTAYWSLAIGIFLSVYCSLRQYSLSFFL